MAQKLISLQEASRLTGYSSDYIGSLIRAKKIHGKKVVGSSAWLVESSEVVDYAIQNRGGKFQSRREKLVEEKIGTNFLFGDKSLKRVMLSMNIIAVAVICMAFVSTVFFAHILLDVNQRKIDVVANRERMSAKLQSAAANLANIR